MAIGPHCIVEAGARLGDRVVLMGGSYVGHAAVVGEDTCFYPRVVLREECVVGCGAREPECEARGEREVG